MKDNSRIPDEEKIQILEICKLKIQYKLLEYKKEEIKLLEKKIFKKGEWYRKMISFLSLCFPLVPCLGFIGLDTLHHMLLKTRKSWMI